MAPIRFTAPLSTIGSWTIVHLPKSVSAKFPSRGMNMAEGSINSHHAEIPLEPDGKGSHWFSMDTAMRKVAKAKAGDTVTLAIEPMKDWPEPPVPADLKKALAAAPKSQTTWMETTPMARWDWVRWIGSTKEPAARAKRIVVACSKLKSGMKRPCCFNRSMCCEPAVWGKSGVLLGA